MDYKEYMRKASINTNEQNIQYINEGNLEAVVNGNLRYAAMMVNRFGNPTNYDDLFQEAIIGLWYAAQNFDTSTNHSFVVYSSWWIKKQIFEYFDNCKTIRIPKHIKREISKFNKLAEDEYFNIYDYQEEFDKSVFNYLKDPISTFSIDVPDTTHYNDRVQEIEDKGPIFEDYETEAINKKMIADAMTNLNEKQKEVISKYYGLDDTEPMTMQQIGDELGVTRQAIEQQIKKIMEKLKKNIKKYPGF